MSPEELAQEASKKIKEWVVGKNKLVVGIDGYTGSGKTTLLNNLEKLNPSILAVHCDDFMISGPEFDKKLNEAPDKSIVFELKRTDFVAVGELISAFRDAEENVTSKEYDLTKKIMVVEGCFLFHPKISNHLWDKRIYLDGDIEKIDRRRVEREKARWGDKYFPETHPDSWFRQVIIALKRYREEYKPEQQADLVLKTG